MRVFAMGCSSLRAKRSNPFFLQAARWIASRSLSSGARSSDLLAPRNDGEERRPHTVVIPAKAGILYARLIGSITAASEYWFRLRSLSYGGQVTRPTALNMASRSRGAMRPSFAGPLSLLEREGAGKTGCALHPRSRVQCAFKEKRTRAYRFSGNTPAFPARWLYGLFRTLPGDRALLSPSFPRSVSFLET